MKKLRLLYVLPALFALALGCLFMGNLVAQTNAVAPGISPDLTATVQPIVTSLVLAAAIKYPWVGTILLVMGALRVVFKPVCLAIHTVLDSTNPGLSGNMKDWEGGPIAKWVMWFLDLFASVKVSPPAPKA